MDVGVTIDLARLRSATATYVAILYDSLPALEDLTTADSAPDQHHAELMARLRDSVEAALDIADAPGTPAAILTTLCQLSGSVPPAAGADGCRPKLSLRIHDASSPVEWDHR